MAHGLPDPLRDRLLFLGDEMTPKEAHEFVRKASDCCPCCGHPLMVVLAQEVPSEDAKEFARLATKFKEEGAFKFVCLEDAAEGLQDGSLEKVWVPA